ncbi:MAG: VTT domain-containing protein [Clostridium sp.]|nr:VTT domain-containing protein [Clostridium sp.]MCM1207302.1 VTT domain-containing protein [Ruminococcus sp.]
MVRRKIYYIVLIVILIIWSILVFVNRNELQGYAVQNYILLFLGCFFANSVAFLPTSGLALVVSSAMIFNPIAVAIISGVGFTLGGCIGYFGGLLGRSNLHDESITIINDKFRKYGAFIILITAFVSLPIFDYVGVYSGIVKYSFSKVLVLCLIGKILKTSLYTMIAIKAYYF